MQLNARMVDLLAIHRSELLERVIPFWMPRTIDWEYGGILTCIRDDGRLISTDKYMWSQLRAIWTFSALYNRIEARPEWLDVARQITTFVCKHGRDELGRWVFAVDRQGNVREGAISIYSDGFAIYGLTEFARAAGDQQAVDLALATYKNVRERLARPGSYATAPYAIPPGAKAHAVAMIFALAFHELGLLLNDAHILSSAHELAEDVMTAFLRPEQRLLYEYVGLDNQLIDAPQGRAIVPGHAIESMWFMIHIYQHWGDKTRIRQALESIRWHIELGWDHVYGGIVLARDAAGGEPWWPFADSKLWWPHTEALYALLLAYQLSGEAWALDWYEKVHNYAFMRFPVHKHGEWTQKLDREGRPFDQTVALPVKDPFHLPRALILCIDTLQSLSNND
ncbi:MAG: hypothetical protein GXP42_18805 [Chloroflexi bacterium]|nr:hypothetical protein [Chloroflexota bacterium]